MIECPLLKRSISEGYCFDLCNVADDKILFHSDKGKIKNWDEAQKMCKQCGVYEE